jgi:hypothetical protein
MFSYLISSRGRSPVVILLSFTLLAGLIAFILVSAPLAESAIAVEAAETTTFTTTVYLPLVRVPFGFYPQPPHPLNVRASLDITHAVSSTLPLQGGMLSAIAADGTRYTLIVPETALLVTQTVTMTPLSGMTGLPPEGQWVAGVQLAPDGLRLYDVATLIITPSVSIPITQEVSLAYLGDGQEIHRFPLALGTPSIVFKVTHFSGYNLAQQSGGSFLPPKQYPPNALESQFASEAQELLSKERQAELLGQEGDPEFAQKYEQLVRDFFNKVIVPRLEVAKTDCAQAKTIIPMVFGWERQQLLVPTVNIDAEEATIREAFGQALDNCWEKVTKPCMGPPDSAQFREALGILRQALLLGILDEDDDRYNPFLVEPKCTCAMLAEISSWTGSLNFTYEKAGQRTVSNYLESVSVQRSADVSLALTEWSNAGPTKIWKGDITSGNAKIHDVWMPGALRYDIAGEGAPGSSQASLTLNQLSDDRCVFWFDVRVYVLAQNDVIRQEAFSVVGRLKVNNWDAMHPGGLKFYGQFAMAARAIDSTPNPILLLQDGGTYPQGFGVFLEQVLGTDGMGTAEVMWTLSPDQAPVQ